MKTILTLGFEIAKVLKEPEVVERLARAGPDATTGSAEELRQLVQRDTGKYRRIIELIGAPPAAGR